MAYDIIRWICGVVLFTVLLSVMCIVTKKKGKKTGKAAVTAAFTAIIITAVSFFIPIENAVHPFKSVEDIFSYRYHEELLTYFQCDEGVVCIAGRSDGSNINYCFEKRDGKYYLPFNLVDDTQRRSSIHGIFIIKKFDTQTIVFTQVSGTQYDGEDFTDGGMGYSYYVIDGKFNSAKLTYEGEKIQLV